MNPRIAISALALLALPVPAPAQEINIAAGEEEGLPLRIEELLTERGRTRLDLDFVLSARSEDEIRSATQTVALGGGQFVTPPSPSTLARPRRTRASSWPPCAAA